MHYPWIRSAKPAPQIPGVSTEVFHWAFDRPNGNIIEGDTGGRSVNFNGTWQNISGNNWAARFTTSTGASSEYPVAIRNNTATVKLRFRPLSWESGGTIRYLLRLLNGANNAGIQIWMAYNTLKFDAVNYGGGQANIDSIHTKYSLDTWHDIVATFTTSTFGVGSIPAGYNIPRVWVNGQYAVSSAGGSGGHYNVFFPHYPVVIGTTNSATSSGFHCDLDYIKIFSGYQSYPLGNP